MEPENFSIETLTNLFLLVKKELGDRELLHVRNILDSYTGHDWQPLVTFSDESYNKIRLISDDQFDIFLICWKAGQQTAIHDHPSRGCLMKVLTGSLEEYVFDSDNLANYIGVNFLEKGQIGYKIDKSLLHQIKARVDSVSIHIYSPGGYKPTVFEF